jgi:hypothetical protein
MTKLVEREPLIFIRSAPKPTREFLAEMVVVDEDGKQTIIPMSLRRTLLIATTGLSLMHNKGVWDEQEARSSDTIH